MGTLADTSLSLMHSIVSFSEGSELRFSLRCQLDFSLVIEYWKQLAASDKGAVTEYARIVLDQWERTPDLHGSITDLSVIPANQQFVDTLLGAVIAPAFGRMNIALAMIPFEGTPIYLSPYLHEILSRANHDLKSVLSKLETDGFLRSRLISAYTIILSRFYNIDIRYELPMIIALPSPQTGLQRYFQIKIDPQFTTVDATMDLPVLSHEQEAVFRSAQVNLTDWMKILPPDNFEFHGVVIATAVDITEQEVISSLKYDLLERGSIIATDRVEILRDRIRILLGKADVQLGLAGVHGDLMLLLEKNKKTVFSLGIEENCKISSETLRHSVYARSIIDGKPTVIDNLTLLTERTDIENSMLAKGIRSLLIAPLKDGDDTIGVLELASPNPGDLTSVDILRLGGVLPLFALAIRRDMNEHLTRVQAVIKEKCTAIHPTVEWRFQEAAHKYLRNLERGIERDMESIVFDNVYPLYGQSDIRDSSLNRNAAIREDLVQNLILTRNIVESAGIYKALPILDDLRHRIDKRIAELQEGLRSEDEVGTMDFIRRELEPHFDHLSTYGEEVRKHVANIRSTFDPSLGMVYAKRKQYEDTVTLINEAISSHIEDEQEKAQQMFPHYFEKYKTDGVEHSMYIGQSLVSGHSFDPLYLKNLRLWQLMLLVGCARKGNALKSKLPIPLELTHLILVQDAPLSIRFRMDEKRFDVDGTYNIRYEILKKRIDKANVRGHVERLTQPGRIAIVYAQPKEAWEYKRYISYLTASGYLSGVVEDLELEDLQGVSGLRALRVAVNFDSETPQPHDEERKISEFLRELTKTPIS